MLIELTPEQEAWLKTRVANGSFASVADAISSILDERISVEDDDLAWAKPLVEEGERAFERGDVMTLDEFRSRTSDILKSLKN